MKPKEALAVISDYIESASSAASFVVRNTEKHGDMKGNLRGADWTECALESYAAMNFNAKSQAAREAVAAILAIFED